MEYKKKIAVLGFMTSLVCLVFACYADISSYLDRGYFYFRDSVLKDVILLMHLVLLLFFIGFTVSLIIMFKSKK